MSETFWFSAETAVFDFLNRLLMWSSDGNQISSGLVNTDCGDLVYAEIENTLHHSDTFSLPLQVLPSQTYQ